MSFFEEIAYGRDHIIKFVHVATGTEVSFPAFIKQFSDNYNVQWQSTDIFGRTDPIQSYQNTKRSIDIGFDVLSDSLEKAKENMEKYSTLKRMLYPMYGEPLTGGDFGAPGAKGRTMRAPPYIRIKFMNYIENVSDTSFEEGLLGCIKGLKFDPKLGTEGPGTFIDENNKLLPKYFSVQFGFEPQHEQTLGWDEQSQFLTEKFPYNTGVRRGSPQLATTTNEDVRKTNERKTLKEYGD